MRQGLMWSSPSNLLLVRTATIAQDFHGTLFARTLIQSAPLPDSNNSTGFPRNSLLHVQLIHSKGHNSLTTITSPLSTKTDPTSNHVEVTTNVKTKLSPTRSIVSLRIFNCALLVGIKESDWVNIRLFYLLKLDFIFNKLLIVNTIQSSALTRVDWWLL